MQRLGCLCVCHVGQSACSVPRIMSDAESSHAVALVLSAVWFALVVLLL